MSFKILATMALATGFAAAKPINAPQNLPAYSKRNVGGAFNNGFNGQGFNFIDGFNAFNQQQQVIQIQEQNLQIIDNGFQQQVVQQVNEVLIVDQQNNGFNNDLNNLFRQANFANQFGGQSTVVMVVQEIQVAVDDGFGNQFQQNIFAQSALVANAGQAFTQSLMVFEAKTLIAQDILGGGFNGLNNNGFAAPTNFANNGVALPTKTRGVQLFGAKPTWSSVASDPAATLGGIWQNELQALQKADDDAAINDLNNQLAAQEKAQLDGQQNVDDNADDNVDENVDDNADDNVDDNAEQNGEEEKKQ